MGRRRENPGEEGIKENSSVGQGRLTMLLWMVSTRIDPGFTICKESFWALNLSEKIRSQNDIT